MLYMKRKLKKRSTPKQCDTKFWQTILYTGDTINVITREKFEFAESALENSIIMIMCESIDN